MDLMACCEGGVQIQKIYLPFEKTTCVGSVRDTDVTQPKNSPFNHRLLQQALSPDLRLAVNP
ncbi:hypothetical protein KR52_12205 [Synechococcus sp. KORDI-52]|nr:hypothetical protein KR52_12205 [Synechococcus sp. KORDI-52]